MAVIKNAPSLKKEKIRAETNANILNNINHYCSWAKINDLGFFIEEAACFIFAKDKEWKNFQKNAKKMVKANI